MKRENFRITSNTGDGKLIHDTIKHKWNSAVKEMQALLQSYANEQTDSTFWEMVESDVIKLGFYHVSGKWVWQSNTGKQLIFSVEKID